MNSDDQRIHDVIYYSTEHSNFSRGVLFYGWIGQEETHFILNEGKEKIKLDLKESDLETIHDEYGVSESIVFSDSYDEHHFCLTDTLSFGKKKNLRAP
mmetsp:Transcript_3856/g.4794  ORF Transcript_3856/g.4794 Transcript_3856/m.4794 type:complete len:98 (+) Transcript_3856:33-326(+)